MLTFEAYVIIATDSQRQEGFDPRSLLFFCINFLHSSAMSTTEFVQQTICICHDSASEDKLLDGGGGEKTDGDDPSEEGTKGEVNDSNKSDKRNSEGSSNEDIIHEFDF